MAGRYQFSEEEIKEIEQKHKENKDQQAQILLVWKRDSSQCALPPYCNAACMNLFLTQLSEQYPDDVILLCCDSAAWHTSGGLNLPDNIVLFYIPPYTPEMNPIEQIWKEIRKRGFHNEVFASLEKVVEQLCDTICSLSNQVISSISGRDWIIKAFN